MSKVGSKVIKADRLAVSRPFSIQRTTRRQEPANSIPTSDVITVLGQEQVIVEGLSEHQELGAAEEAANILVETEEMVKELLASAREQAEIMQEQARDEAESLVLEARSEVDLLAEQARQNGYREGYAYAIETAQAEAHTIRQEAKQIMEQASEEKAKLMAGTELEIVQLALLVAEKIIREELAAKTDLVAVMVKEALAKATDREAIVVKVNPDDLDYILSISEELRKEIRGIRKFKVISDGIISRGGCIVETPNGSVDARIERQLTEIREALMEVS